ncbi:MAG: tRNA-dihydrouridine synthase [Patescibacteria group bacterium]
MEKNFWQQLPRPIIGLSPMDGVTDHPYRFIQKKYGMPTIVYTEFTSVEGVCHGANRLLQDFLYDETQRPIVAQIYGTSPDYFRQTSIILCQLGFDGIDINMGCPAKNVAHSGAGAALIQTPELAQQIVQATKTGVKEWQNGATVRDCPDITPKIAAEIETKQSSLPASCQSRERTIPVSVKTRIGYSTPIVTEWIPRLLETQPSAIALHGRTLKQQYSGQANWEEIGKAAQLCAQTSTLLLGNGDVKSRQDALQKVADFAVDGVLLGRCTFGNPFVFLDTVPEHQKLFSIAIEHAEIFEKTYQQYERYSFLPMRKHLGWYVRGVPNASEIRVKLFQSNSAAEVREIFRTAGLIT